jgi:mono/diheme cytochrome c family protein
MLTWPGRLLFVAPLSLVGLACTAEPTPASEDDTQADEDTGADTDTDTDEGTDTGGPVECLGAPGPWDLGYAIEPDTTPSGDPEAGLHALVHQDYVPCGIPYDLFIAAAQLVPSLQGETLPWRDGKAADLPFDWNLVVSEGGTELVSANCLTCHAGYLNGELVIGLGRHDADFTNTTGIASLLPELDPETDAGQELAKFKARTEVVAPFIQTYTIGTNPAEIVAVVLAAHRDPETLAWSDEPLIDVNPQMIPTDTPPWWRVKKKNAHFYNGMSRGDHRGSMMFASSLCSDDVESVEQMVEYFADIRAYLESLEPPVYPWAIDQTLAAEGEEIFECNCAGCHGTYSSDPDAETYPNLLLPLALVGTDPAMAEGSQDPGVSPTVDWFNASWYGQFAQLLPAQPFVGYTAPPLDGIWATAPFLHNGSVPSIELVLDSSKRPSYWKRATYDSTDYDQAQLGWRWFGVDEGQDQAPEGERQHIYDTTIYAHGNGGHTFGDHLSDEERTAVLEYLKTI